MSDKSETKIYCWTQGGSGDNMTLAEATAYLTKIKDEVDCLWEVRDPGTDAEESWQDGKHEFKTFAEAVDSALPYWKEIGLTWEQAALVAMSSDLVLSTGGEVEEDKTDDD